MKYELVYPPRAIRDISKLDPAVKKRIGATLLRYKENPLHYAEKLTDSDLGHTVSESEIIESYLT